MAGRGVVLAGSCASTVVVACSGAEPQWSPAALRGRPWQPLRGLDTDTLTWGAVLLILPEFQVAGPRRLACTQLAQAALACTHNTSTRAAPNTHPPGLAAHAASVHEREVEILRRRCRRLQHFWVHQLWAPPLLAHGWVRAQAAHCSC